MTDGINPGQSKIRACIEMVILAYQNYMEKFKSITHNAGAHFAKQRWQALQSDTAMRLDLYRKIVDDTESKLRKRFGAEINQSSLWIAAKKEYIQKIARLEDRELAETFFNSITRRIFKTVGVNGNIEFVNSEFDQRSTAEMSPIYQRYGIEKDLPGLMAKIFNHFNLSCNFEDKTRDTRQAAQALASFLTHFEQDPANTAIEMITNPFYRDQGAYQVGRLVNGDKVLPLVFALRNSTQGVYLDAVLIKPEQVSVLFSFSRSYFLVEVDRPHDVVNFLKTLMPSKKKAEIYISLGFNKHGKTELYRHLIGYLTSCGSERFVFSQGKRGMVMIAFNMPHDDMIFKLIRDRFERPKKTSRAEVMQRYDYVFKHERAGRLLDVQTFEHLKIETCCFEERLLEELLSQAAQSVHCKDDHLIFEHIYVERRVTPLDIYLQKADWPNAKAAVIDFGWAIKDLAMVNIFPGDMLIKNFGVSRLGRVLFYDYDELCPLTVCNFRKIPLPRNELDEMASEPWYFVDEHDVFPEEFKFFLGFQDELKEVFLSVHEDLFEVGFWRKTKERILAGELIHISPYSPKTRLQH